MVWAHTVEASPVVASDVGDGPTAFDNPNFRKLLENALKWVASPEARD